jgi:putative membrane protein insertion efficiency factor
MSVPSISKRKLFVVNRVLLLLISFYQKSFSIWLGPCCRFYPSCSEYAKQAFKELNFFKASYKVIGRLLRCGPWHRGGIDFP